MSESLPPIQGPSGSGLTPPPSYLSPPPPKRNNTVAYVIVAIFAFLVLACSGLVGLGVYRANHSGVKVGEVELTQKEVRTAEEEIKTMMASVNPENLSSMNKDLVATNPLSQLVKTYLTELKAAEVDLNGAIEKINVDAILGAQLGSASGRKKSRDEAMQVDVAILKYCGRQMNAVLTYQSKWREAFHLDASFGAGAVSRFQRTQDTYKDLSKTRLELISFADRTKPESDGEHLLFNTTAEITQYNKMTDDYNARFEIFQKAAKEMSKAGSQDFSSSLSGAD